MGGHRGPGPGNWFEPTVFSHVDHSMLLMREETFGPLIGIQAVGSDAEAVERAEFAILERYLPAQISNEELQKIISAEVAAAAPAPATSWRCGAPMKVSAGVKRSSSALIPRRP